MERVQRASEVLYGVHDADICADSPRAMSQPRRSVAEIPLARYRHTLTVRITALADSSSLQCAGGSYLSRGFEGSS